MKKITFLILVFSVAISGCATVQNRMTRLKDRNENTIMVSFSGNIEAAKAQIRLIGAQMALIEPKGVETGDFMLLRTNLVKSSIYSAFGIMGAIASGATKLGFSLAYNKETNITDITIIEEVSCIISPSRFVVADRLKLRSLELAKK